ncbi:MAG: FHA domain-containing protein [Chloroflexota bacterium]|nr:MAG: FHA domain-containing protein [Chloroflexota bacterium]
MNPAVVLLILRLLSALLLLSFFGLLAWLIYRDIKLTTIGAANGRAIKMGSLRVVVESEGHKEFGPEYPLYMETTIGRAASNVVVLDDVFASNEHARISRVGSQWWLEDLDSRNGTLLNDALLESPTVVTGDDIITVGRTTLELELAVSE